MDIVNSIASASMSLGSSNVLSAVNVAMLGKVLDTAQAQGEAIEQMMEAAPAPNGHVLDVYA